MVEIVEGGWGSRLGKQTEEIPKPMVQIGGKPIIWHIMQRYAKYGACYVHESVSPPPLTSLGPNTSFVTQKIIFKNIIFD